MILAKDPRAPRLNGAGVLTENRMSITQGFQQVSGAEQTRRRAEDTEPREAPTTRTCTRTQQRHCFAGEHRVGFSELFRGEWLNPPVPLSLNTGAEISHAKEAGRHGFQLSSCGSKRAPVHKSPCQAASNPNPRY